MSDPAEVEAQPEYCYDVQLAQRPTESLLSQFPSITVQRTEAQTALRRRVSGPEQFDALLHELGTVGLTLTDVHRVTSADQREGEGVGPPQDVDGPDLNGPATYEVRVAGELGGPLLRYLRCSHYVIPELTLVRLAVVGAELNRFLQACTDSGARLERVRRVGVARA